MTCRDQSTFIKINKCACTSICICTRLSYGRLRYDTFTEVKTKIEG